MRREFFMSVLGVMIAFALAGSSVPAVAVTVGWGTPTLLETNSAGDSQNPQVAVDPSGSAIAVWHQGGGARWNIWANRFVPGIGWDTAAYVTLIRFDQTPPRLFGIIFFKQDALDWQGGSSS